MRSRSAPSSSRRASACASASGSPAGTSTPVSPSATSSRDAADVGGHHRQPGRHRLEDRERRALRPARQHEHVGARQERRNVVAIPEQRDPLAEPVRSQLLLHARLVATAADEGERVAASAERRQRAHQRQRVLGRGEPADGHDPRWVAVEPGARRALDVDRVGDDDGSLGAAGLRGQPGRALGLRHADRHRGQRRQQPVGPAVEPQRSARRTP